MAKKIAPIHPGEILLAEFLKPLGVSQYRLAKSIGVPPRQVNEIVAGKRSISADTALRFGIYFRTSPQLWLNLQSRHDLEVEKDWLGTLLEKEIVELAPVTDAATRRAG